MEFSDEFIIDKFRERIEDECGTTLHNIYINKKLLDQHFLNGSKTDTIRIYWSADNWSPENNLYCQKIYANNFCYRLEYLQTEYRNYNISKIL